MGFQNITTGRYGCADGDTGTAANLSGSTGLVVKDEGSDFASLCISATTSDDRPLGIICGADVDSTENRLAIVCFGRADAIAGAAITPGPGSARVMVNGSGQVIPLVVPADAAVQAVAWSVGWVDSQDGEVVAAGEKIRIFVDPQLHSNFYTDAN